VPSILSGDSVFTNIGATNNPHLIQGDCTLKSNSQKAFLVKTGGHLRIVKTLEIAGHFDPANANSASLGMTGGKITATNSYELKVTHGFAMSGGDFKTTNTGAVGGNFTLYLNGNMIVTDGTIELSQNTQGAELGALSVMGTSGQVSFTGGVYKAKIVAGSPERSRWISQGTFTTTAAATITPIVSNGTLPAKVVNAPLYWNVISAGNAFPVNPVLPTIGDANFTSRLDNARKEYDLKW